MKVLFAHACLTLCDPADYSLPGSSVCGILQARTLEWVAMPSPEDLPDAGTEPTSPALASGFFIIEPLREAPICDVAILYSLIKKHW